MSSASVSGDFISIHVEIIWELKGPSPFDIYISRASEKFTKLFPKGEEIDRKRLEFYRDQKSVNALFVLRADFEIYLALIESMANQALESKDPIVSGQMGAFLSEMTRSVTTDVIHKTSISSAEVHAAETAALSCIKLISKNPVRMIEILRSLSQHPYSLRHSLTTMIFSLLLADAVDMKSDHSKQIIGLGALLHDIGMSRLPFNAEIEEELTADQWKEVKEHPQLGKRIIDAIPDLPEKVASIVLEHHEQPNGLGYPNGIRGAMIYTPSKIVAIADSFSALLIARAHRKAPITAKEALKIMKNDRGRYEIAYLEIFTKLLAPTR